jgi:DNA end-binding protein Ku
MSDDATRSWKATANVDLTMPGGLFSVPVQIFSAVESHDRKGHLFHAHVKKGDDGNETTTYASIKMPKICGGDDGCGAVVPKAEQCKGYEDDDGELVVLTDDELETISENAGAEWEILRYVRLKEIEPLMFCGEKAYYVAPDKKKKMALHCYKALVRILEEEDLVGVMEYTRWGSTRNAVLRVQPTDDGGVLVVQNMVWPDEIRRPKFDVLANARDVELDPRLVPMMRSVVESMTEDFDPDVYHDTRQQKLVEAIAAKGAGGVVKREEGDAPASVADDDVSDLLAKLQGTAEAAAKAKVKVTVTHTEKPAAKAAARKAAARKAPAKAAAK